MSMTIPMPVMNNRLSSPGEQKWLLDSLVRRIRYLGEVDHGFSLVIANVDNRTRIFAYTLMPTSWGDTMVYGARYSKASFVKLLEGVLDGNGLLPATFTEGRRNRDVLSLRVRDNEGNMLFDSSPGTGVAHPSSALNAHVELPGAFGTAQGRRNHSTRARRRRCSSAACPRRAFPSCSACSASPPRCRSSP